MSESSQTEPAPEDRYLKKMLGIIRSHTHRERINALFLLSRRGSKGRKRLQQGFSPID